MFLKIQHVVNGYRKKSYYSNRYQLITTYLIPLATSRVVRLTAKEIAQLDPEYRIAIQVEQDFMCVYCKQNETFLASLRPPKTR
jgi:hypothetical protein